MARPRTGNIVSSRVCRLASLGGLGGKLGALPHTTDTLEIASACGLSLRPRRSDEPTLTEPAAPGGDRTEPFDKIIADGFARVCAE